MELTTEILYTLLKQDKTHLRALARDLNKHPTTIRNALKKINIIQTSKDEKLFISFANTEQAKLTKAHLIKLQLFDTGLITHINKVLFEPTIILFGSAQRGETNKHSDIDLFILCDEKKEVETKEFEIHREIQLFIHTKESFRKLSKELRNNILNGDVLQGYVEVYE